MRTLKFEKNSFQYRMLHQATLVAQLPEKLDRKTYKLIDKVQERLESIGKPIETEATEGTETPAIVQHVCPEDASVSFEEEEFQMLRRLFDNTTFVVGVARRVSEINDMLDSIPEEKPGPKLVD
jgi:hypothetical protein